ncbi:leucine-rich repeat domain-containing protein [Cellulophaga lytica]|uniref:Leucine-rich repeat-containing protein n=1 Tax=Cellulophaga lytica (strain ATCC 23178 / DSM 7489 / JCM 8516 / NBRC 14961 / NCIMB 1423 / VKM B-1433 / Cy l20) TaxID=867900 RepID=F0R9M7_CELLC|nr:leucine-rich repeat domain-containing protein [Cellulophaga lytica]ADY29359.1 leucine-rich repeat-containing protein [Cellulophaga lytica DSM 7489]WQG76466.1 leucine-rich repeat domain-containing protein [Cellulophaga lytica]
MEIKIILYGISIFTIITGSWILYYAIKKWNPDFKPKKLTAKLLREILGSKGSQIFSGIMGGILILFGITLTYLMLTKDMRSKSNKYAKSEWILITKFDGKNRSVLNSKIEIENKKISRMGKEHLKGYQQISFKDMGIDKIPDFVWDMTNLETLDLTNNEISKIPNEISKLTKLRRLILTGNNIENKHLKELEELTGAEITKPNNTYK